MCVLEAGSLAESERRSFEGYDEGDSPGGVVVFDDPLCQQGEWDAELEVSRNHAIAQSKSNAEVKFELLLAQVHCHPWTAVSRKADVAHDEHLIWLSLDAEADADATEVRLLEDSFQSRRRFVLPFAFNSGGYADFRLFPILH